MDESLLNAHPIHHYNKLLWTAYLLNGDRLIYAKCDYSTYFFIDIIENHDYSKFERSFRFTKKDYEALNDMLSKSLPIAL